MNALARIAKEMAEAQRSEADRAYGRLKAAAEGAQDIALSDHQLVMAIRKALWERELLTVQYGLSELELRTAADQQRMIERRAA